MRLPKASRSWPLLAIFGASAISAGVAANNDLHPAAGAALLVVGSIAFGAWLVTEIIWLFTHMEDDRYDDDDDDGGGEEVTPLREEGRGE